MRSPFVSGTVVVVLGRSCRGRQERGRAEPKSPVWLAALVVLMVLASVTDPVRFGWREPDEPRRPR
jgi:hypothetical protein